MNEVAGTVRCPQCDSTCTSSAAYCSGCGAALGLPLRRLKSGALPGQALYQPHPSMPAPNYPAPAHPTVQFQAPQVYQQPPAPYTPPQSYLPQPYQPQYPAPHGYEPPYQPAAASSEAPRMYGAYPAQGAPINVTVSPVINVHGAMQAPYPPQAPVVVVNQTQVAPSMVVRAIWFLFIGLWLGLIATVVGWALCVAVVTLPLGLLILNRLPALMTLQPPERTTQIVHINGVTTVSTGIVSQQYPFMLRAVYFVLVGWWASLIWLVFAWLFVALAVPTFGMTLVPAFMMFNRVPNVLTLRLN